MRLIDADALKKHIDKLPALPDGNFAGNHSALKALINMQPTIEPSPNYSESPNGWIPVSKETNPSTSGWYIVTCPEEMTASNERFSGIAEYNAVTGEWFDMDEPTDCYLAYMPLPEPYQSKEDD